MSRHTDANHNIWYDPIVLTNCAYVHCQDGCTGEITDCNYAEIGENNKDLSISDTNYLTIGTGNKNLTITKANYAIIGSDCENIKLGEHSKERFAEKTGAESVTVGHRVLGAEITGHNSKFDDSRNIEIDGTFNSMENSGVVFLDSASGNSLKNSSMVDLTKTNNNKIETKFLNLTEKQAFVDYAMVEKVTRVKNLAPAVNKQSDVNGVIYDKSLNVLVNPYREGDPKEGSVVKDKVVLKNNVWVKVKT